MFLLIFVPWSIDAQAQRTVSGTVTDEAGDVLIGVAVVVEGSTVGTTTGTDGTFSLRVPGNDAVLLFQYMGYRNQSVAVGTRSELDIVMYADASVLDEVVVVGYGVQQKKLVTGATVQVKGDDVAKLNTVSVLGALQSQTPGVNITQRSGMPGQGFRVNIRGMGTIGNSDPLYVIDGAPGGDINSLNPADIESIDVLKDAASAAIYGSRAANGVILVTTKHGRAGQKAQVSFDAYYGIQNVFRMPQMLNAQQYAFIQNEGRLMDGTPVYDYATAVYGPEDAGLWEKIESGEWTGTDWLEESRNKNAPIQNYAVNITGGTDQGSYAMGFSYTSQEGILGKPVSPSFERYTGRINTQFTLVKGASHDILTIGENLTYSHTITPGGMRINGDMYWNDIMWMMQASPFLPKYDEEGNYHKAIPWFPAQGNPIALMENNQNTTNRNHALRTNVFLDFQPIPNLVFRSNFGYSVSSWISRGYNRKFDYGSAVQQSGGAETVRQGIGTNAGMSWENTVNYNFAVGDNNFTVLLGQSLEKSGGVMGEQLNATSVDPKFHDLEHAYIDNAPIQSWTPNHSLSGRPEGMHQLASFFGRLSYDYRGKYMATVVLRADGSSNFARGHRWGYFPSISAGWIITEENFMQGTRSWMDFFKIRASWGQNGNQSINNFQYLAPISSGSSYIFGPDKSAWVQGAYPSMLSNPDISWETSEQIDIGFDASFLRNRLGVTFDYFVKNTKDWLVRAPQLESYGTGAPDINGGDIRNSGFEISVDWNDRVGDFTYGINVNASYQKNEVTRIANTEGIINGVPNFMFQGQEESFRAQVGYPIGYFFGYQTDGIFQNQAEIDAYTGAKLTGNNAPRPGDVIWVDRNGDGAITTADRGMIGNPHPDLRMGLSLSLGWKGIDLSMNLVGVFGNEIMRSWRSWADTPKHNYTTEILGRWHGEGTSNRLPRMSAGAHPNIQWVSNLFIEKGDYVRIQNLTLGYNLNQVIKSGFLSQARIYVTAQNLYTFTGYSGMDPEIGSGSQNAGWSSGIDVGFYPTPRTFMLGVNLKF